MVDNGDRARSGAGPACARTNPWMARLARPP